MTPKRNSTNMTPEYAAALREIEKLDTLNDEALAALWKIADHIPELWGDECKDGYVRLNISADAIEAVQAAICRKASDSPEQINTDLLKSLKVITKHDGCDNFVAKHLVAIATEAIRKAEEKR